MSNLIQVFEHSSLRVGGPFTRRHFDRLVLYNERHGNRLFDVGRERIHFGHYVGVIQVGHLTIEILPKADREPESPSLKQRWQRVLVEMLRRSGLVRLSAITDARLRLRSASLLDTYFESFLAEVEELVHHGLVRRYDRTQRNLPALKGRLLFQQQVSLNVVHQERFFTDHVVYDRNNRFNQVLRLALDVLVRVTRNPHLCATANDLLLSFQDFNVIPVHPQMFDRVVHTRNTECYRRALQLARLILLNYAPDVRSGREDVISILFDMNLLFERYVLAELKRAEANQKSHGIRFKSQVSSRFWAAEGRCQSIRPDIVAQVNRGSGSERVILDTKWKVPNDRRPADSDLHQMHSYNIHFGARQSLLVYPRVSAQSDVQGRFVKDAHTPDVCDHGCGMMFVELFAGDRLRPDLGAEISRNIYNLS